MERDVVRTQPFAAAGGRPPVRFTRRMGARAGGYSCLSRSSREVRKRSAALRPLPWSDRAMSSTRRHAWVRRSSSYCSGAMRTPAGFPRRVMTMGPSLSRPSQWESCIGCIRIVYRDGHPSTCGRPGERPGIRGISRWRRTREGGRPVKGLLRKAHTSGDDATLDSAKGVQDDAAC
jgi:hypothetical protein